MEIIGVKIMALLRKLRCLFIFISDSEVNMTSVFYSHLNDNHSRMICVDVGCVAGLFIHSTQ